MLLFVLCPIDLVIEVLHVPVAGNRWDSAAFDAFRCASPDPAESGPRRFWMWRVWDAELIWESLDECLFYTAELQINSKPMTNATIVKCHLMNVIDSPRRTAYR